MNYRIGQGFDLHQFADDRDLILGGIKIPYEQGLLGHSDADVLTHAIADALLGAAGKRDIGYYFPDTDIRYKGVSSLLLLSEVQRILNEDGYFVGNIDCTLIAQAPKMAPYLLKMRENLASALKTDVENINIKATTEEKLGFTGRKEGISAHAVCIILKN